MSSNKETGSYYTPFELIAFMNRYLQNNKQDFSSVLEPSAGDGRFLSVLLPQCGKVKAIELFEDKVQEIEQNYASSNLKVEKHNFLDYAIQSQEKFSLIIGNPPYINLKLMNKNDIDKAKALCQQVNLQSSVMQNMWLAFVVGASRMLINQGTIFFVLPMEFLQVQYAEKLRIQLEGLFNTIHIISFKEPVFPEIEQEVCLLYMTNRAVAQPYISYEIYQTPTDEISIFSNVIKKNKPLKKWTNAILSDEEILLIKKQSEKYNKIDSMGECAPGIVTGGNQYFIISKEKVTEYACEDFVIPILQKSSYISKPTIFLDACLLNELDKKKKPAYLLDLAGKKNEDLPIKLKEYLEWAKVQKVGEQKLVERFKCAHREPWYGVPIVRKGEVVFFKRYHLVPRMYINQAEIHTTDAGYHLRLNTQWDGAKFVFCFYNSLTLAQCEFEGRYYGGGVNELVPSEFKELRVPYYDIDEKDIKKLDDMFQTNEGINEIIAFVNERTIAKDMDRETVKKIEQIRRKLVERRL